MTMAIGKAIDFAPVSRGSDGTYFDAAGVLQTAGPNVLRLTHDPATGKALGALLEGAGTNLAINSDKLDSFTFGNATKADSGIPSPIAGVNWQRIEVVASANTTISQTINSVPSATPTLSVYLRKGSGATDLGRIGFYNRTTAANVAFVDLNYDTGAITWVGAQNGTARAVSLGGGSWLLSVTPATGVSSGDNLTIYAGSIGAVQTAGKYFYAAGVMLGTLPFPTSYIKTTTTSAQRLADNLSFARAGTPEGTITINARSSPGIGTVYGQSLIWWTDGTSDNRIVIFRSVDRHIYYQVKVGGAQPVSIDLGLVADSTEFRLDATWKEGRYGAALNSAEAIVSGYSGPAPALNDLKVGRSISANQEWFGTLASLRLVPRYTPLPGMPS